MTEIRGARVLITGATGGFGQHLVQQLGAAGGRVVMTDCDAASLESLRERAQGAIEAAIPADLGDAAGCQALCQSIRDAGLAPDILVNNAGIAAVGRLDHVPVDRWESLMQINLLAPMRLTAALLPQMLTRGRGHIVNVSSLAGWIGSPHLSSYCAAKFGLRGFGEALMLDLAQTGIRVSTVYPSFSRTPILDSEQFGFDERRVVPDELLSDPADVVRRIVEGVRRNRAHIFPDPTSRVMHYLVRYVPAVIPLLQRRLERRTRGGP